MADNDACLNQGALHVMHDRHHAGDPRQRRAGVVVRLPVQSRRHRMFFAWELRDACVSRVPPAGDVLLGTRLNWFVARIGTEGMLRNLVHPSTVVKFIVKNALQVRVLDPPVSPESSDPHAAVERFSALSGILTKFGLFDSDIAVVKMNPRDTMHNA